MTGYAIKWIAAALGFLVLGVIGILVFTSVWADVGLVAAIVVICTPLVLWAWHVDRKEKAQRAQLTDI